MVIVTISISGRLLLLVIKQIISLSLTWMGAQFVPILLYVRKILNPRVKLFIMNG